jgi:hypothetical protein
MEGMVASRSLEIDDEPTPKPASAVNPIASDRRAHLLDHFAGPSSVRRAIDAAWEEALALYGDEDSDAWVSALEDGTHPLCGVKTA